MSRLLTQPFGCITQVPKVTLGADSGRSITLGKTACVRALACRWNKVRMVRVVCS